MAARFCLVLALLGGACADPPGRERSRPNVVLLIADDQDFEHLGFLGHPLAPTPALDALAAAGAVFPLAHTAPRCRPALAGLLTGRHAHQTGAFANASRVLVRGPNLLPRLLARSGYRTFAAGKFWEGDPRAVGLNHGPPQNEAGNGLATDTFVRRDQAELFAFLEDCGERPFFVWWAPMLPHVPHDPPAELLARFPPERLDPPPWIAPGDGEAWRAAEARSLAMVAWLDRGVGELVAKLEELGQREDTLFLFLIDNGWSNGLPSKGTPYEKGVRTPIVVSGPGVPAGVHPEHLASYLDVMPTALDYARLPIPGRVEGRSLRPVIEGRSPAWREALFGAAYAAEAGPAHRPEDDLVALFARDERWKLVLWARDVGSGEADALGLKHLFAPPPLRARRQVELFDLERDPYERTDLSGDPARAERVRRMTAALNEWWLRTGGAPLPP